MIEIRIADIKTRRSKISFHLKKWLLAVTNQVIKTNSPYYAKIVNNSFKRINLLRKLKRIR
jgi:hypothetical protein